VSITVDTPLFYDSDNGTLFIYAGIFGFIDQYGAPFTPSQSQIDQLSVKINGFAATKANYGTWQSNTYYIKYNPNFGSIYMTFCADTAPFNISLSMPGIPELLASSS
jgi:hypothetical protein